MGKLIKPVPITLHNCVPGWKYVIRRKDNGKVIFEAIAKSEVVTGWYSYEGEDFDVTVHMIPQRRKK